MVVGSHFCDNVICDTINGKISLIGIFSQINVASPFPYRPPSFWFFVSLTNGRGLNNWTQRVIHTSSGKIIWLQSGTIKFNNPLVVATLQHRFQVLFPNPGIYSFEMLIENELIIERKLIIRQITKQAIS